MADDSCYYQLSLSNVSIEDDHNSSISTASNMTISLDKELNLHDQIYMKSLAAQCSLDNFSLSNLPNTFSDNESIDLRLTVPNSMTDGNAVFGAELNEKRNKNPCKLPIKSLVTADPQIAVNHVNTCIREYCNIYLCLRYLEIICDTDLFRDECMATAQNLELSPKDFSLLFWYLEIAILYRMQLAAVIDDLLQKTDSTGSRPINRTLPVISLNDENATIQSSTLFKPVSNRTNVTHRLITFAVLHSVDLTDPTDVLHNLVRIINNYLSQQSFLTRINNAITAESYDILNTIRDNNILLLNAAKITHDILRLEQSKHDSLHGKGLAKLYHNEMLKLSLDSTGKCVFNTHPTLFLALKGSEFTVTFGNHASKILGARCSINEHLQIGPITHDPPSIEVNTARSILKKKTIRSTHDRLFCRVEPMPRCIYILSDIISNDCHHKSSWADYSSFAAYQILAAYQINDTDIKTQSISKLSYPRRYYRVKQAENVLRSLNLVIVDESFHPLTFQAKTYCYLSLCLKPADINM